MARPINPAATRMAPAIIIQCGYSQSKSNRSILAIAPSLVTFPSPSAPALRALTGRLSGLPFCKLQRAIYSSDVRSLQATSKTWRAPAGDDLPHKTNQPFLVFASSKLGLSNLRLQPQLHKLAGICVSEVKCRPAIITAKNHLLTANHDYDV